MKTAIALILIGIIFAHVETFYFGNNLHPESWAEVVCDSVALIIEWIGIGKFFYSLDISIKF